MRNIWNLSRENLVRIKTNSTEWLACENSYSFLILQLDWHAEDYKPVTDRNLKMQAVSTEVTTAFRTCRDILRYYIHYHMTTPGRTHLKNIS